MKNKWKNDAEIFMSENQKEWNTSSKSSGSASGKVYLKRKKSETIREGNTDTYTQWDENSILKQI